MIDMITIGILCLFTKYESQIYAAILIEVTIALVHNIIPSSYKNMQKLKK